MLEASAQAHGVPYVDLQRLLDNGFYVRVSATSTRLLASFSCVCVCVSRTRAMHAPFNRNHAAPTCQPTSA